MPRTLLSICDRQLFRTEFGRKCPKQGYASHLVLPFRLLTWLPIDLEFNRFSLADRSVRRQRWFSAGEVQYNNPMNRTRQFSSKPLEKPPSPQEGGLSTAVARLVWAKTRSLVGSSPCKIREYGKQRSSNSGAFRQSRISYYVSSISSKFAFTSLPCYFYNQLAELSASLHVIE